MRVAIILALTTVVNIGRGSTTDAGTAFARLKQLTGNWKGTVEWTGAMKAKREAAGATYHVTGSGSTLIEETMQADGTPYMTTAYHMDNGELRMTHFCSAQNQPRLKADSIDAIGTFVRFGFVDITNLASPDAPHVHGFSIRFVDANHIKLEFAVSAKGQESVEHFALARVAAS